jgi:hypothetical protein
MGLTSTFGTSTNPRLLRSGHGARRASRFSSIARAGAVRVMVFAGFVTRCDVTLVYNFTITTIDVVHG